MLGQSRTGRRKSKIAAALFLTLLLGGSFVVYLNGFVYFVREVHGPGSSAIWHEDEAFIFLNRNTNAKVMRRYQVVIDAFLGFFSNFPIETLHEDLHVFHLEGDKVEHYLLRDFGSGGGAFPFNGELYFERGGSPGDWPYLWRWTGTNFYRINQSDALHIQEQFPPKDSLPHSVSEQIKREGWSEEPFFVFNIGRQMRYPIKLRGHSFTLVTSKSKRLFHESESVVLEEWLALHSKETLSLLEDCGYRQLSRQHYLELKHQPPRVAQRGGSR